FDLIELNGEAAPAASRKIQREGAEEEHATQDQEVEYAPLEQRATIADLIGAEDADQPADDPEGQEIVEDNARILLRYVALVLFFDFF
ncbi:hypothetical protein U1Q18_032286, partial [Sarracenia purpurea var. burkii]